MKCGMIACLAGMKRILKQISFHGPCDGVKGLVSGVPIVLINCCVLLSRVPEQQYSKRLHLAERRRTSTNKRCVLDSGK